MLVQRLPESCELRINAAVRLWDALTTGPDMPSEPNQNAERLPYAAAIPGKGAILWVAVVGDGDGFSVELYYLDGERLVVSEGFVAKIA
jgi:hypothetical protein